MGIIQDELKKAKLIKEQLVKDYAPVNCGNNLMRKSVYMIIGDIYSVYEKHREKFFAYLQEELSSCSSFDLVEICYKLAYNLRKFEIADISRIFQIMHDIINPKLIDYIKRTFYMDGNKLLYLVDIGIIDERFLIIFFERRAITINTIRNYSRLNDLNTTGLYNSISPYTITCVMNIRKSDEIPENGKMISWLDYNLFTNEEILHELVFDYEKLWVFKIPFVDEIFQFNEILELCNKAPLTFAKFFISDLSSYRINDDMMKIFKEKLSISSFYNCFNKLVHKYNAYDASCLNLSKEYHKEVYEYLTVIKLQKELTK